VNCSGVLPELLVDHVVAVQVQRRCRDPAFGLRPAERVRREHDEIANVDVSRAELTEQQCATGSHDDDLHTVIGDRVDRRVSSLRSRQERAELERAKLSRRVYAQLTADPNEHQALCAEVTSSGQGDELVRSKTLWIEPASGARLWRASQGAPVLTAQHQIVRRLDAPLRA